MGTLKVRDYQFDNLKFILIIAVVVGHFISRLTFDYPVMQGLYCVIYSFHIPMFVFVSGYFTRTLTNSDKRMQAVFRFFLTYVIFQVIYYFFYNIVMGSPTKFSIIEPYWAMWYLFAMAVWIGVHPYIERMKYPVLFSLFIGLVSGMNQEAMEITSFSRVLSLFFFFMLGVTFNKKKFEDRVKNIPRIIPILSLIGIFTFIFLISDEINQRWFFGKYSYEQFGVSNIEGAVIQAFIYALTITIMFCLYFVVPKSKTVISELGTRTLYVYLLHGFIVQLLNKFEVYNELTSPISHAMVILFAAGVTFVLSTKFVAKYTEIFVQPDVNFLFKKESELTDKGSSGKSIYNDVT